jgi:ribosome biogenesis GTPase
MSTTYQGIVFKKAIGTYDVHCDGRVVRCEISTRLRRELVYPIADPTSLRPRVMDVKEIQQIDPVAVGDEVLFMPGAGDTGMITEVLPRRNKLTRPEATGPFKRHAFEQVIVANVDQVVPVFAAAQPAPSWNLLDRYLVSAESLDLAALICITKLDLAEDDQELLAAVELYRSIGYQVILTSAVSRLGLEELGEALHGKVSVLVGKSGVGKTSLLNAIHPGLGLRVNAVNEQTGKGRHTTSNLAMIPLDGDGSAGGGAVIDTPGMREFGVWQNNGDDLALMFPEMRPYVGACRFGLDCGHASEPGCAILKALEAGRISRRRYDSLLKLRQG